MSCLNVCMPTTETKCLTNRPNAELLGILGQHSRSSQQLTFEAVEKQQTVQ